MNELRFTGQELQGFFKQFTVTQIRSAMKGSYRACGKKVRAIAVSKLRSSGLHVQGNRSDWTRGIRLLYYKKGTGFLVTVKGIGGKSMHETRRYQAMKGRKLPILSFAEDGTVKRFRKKRLLRIKDPNTSRKKYLTAGTTGYMPAYHFLENATPQMYRVVETDIGRAVEDSVEKVAKKAGF